MDRGTLKISLHQMNHDTEVLSCRMLLLVEGIFGQYTITWLAHKYVQNVFSCPGSGPCGMYPGLVHALVT
jgi:hypothetical protein